MSSHAPTSKELKEYLDLLRPVLLHAGKTAQDLRAKGLIIEQKEDGTLVSNADKTISEYLTHELKKITPGCGVVSEEHPDVSGVNEHLTWVIDPIDGTKKYVQGRDIWCIMVALFDTKPLCSMIYYPDGKVWYFAIRGEGAYMEEHGIAHKLKLGKAHEPPRVVRDPETPVDIGEVGSHGVMKHTRKIIWDKCDCFIRTTVGYWDIVPPMLLIQEAGGTVLDFNGKEIILNHTDAHVSVVLGHTNIVKEVCAKISHS